MTFPDSPTEERENNGGEKITIGAKLHYQGALLWV